MSTPPRTWTSSSLELNSDTSTFSPSATLVSETHSRPEARTCASEGRSRFRPDFITLTRLKEGWRGPRFLFLASFATSITSSQHLAKNESLVESLGFGGWDFEAPPLLWGFSVLYRLQTKTHFFQRQIVTGSIFTKATSSQWPTVTSVSPLPSTEPMLRSPQLLIGRHTHASSDVSRTGMFSPDPVVPRYSFPFTHMKNIYHWKKL